VSCSLPRWRCRGAAGDHALRGDQHDARADQPRPVPRDIGRLQTLHQRPDRHRRHYHHDRPRWLHMHIARNKSSSTTVTVVSIHLNVPTGGSQRIDAPAPGNCPFQNNDGRRPAGAASARPAARTVSRGQPDIPAGRWTDRPRSQRQPSSEQQAAGAADATPRLGCRLGRPGAGARFSTQEIRLDAHRASSSGGLIRRGRSAFCLSFCLIRHCPAPFTGGRPGRVRAGHGRWRTPVNASQHCWKACWVQALASSNLASSAALTCDDALGSCARAALRPKRVAHFLSQLNSGHMSYSGQIGVVERWR
jgi:hypothetical protein